MEELCAVNEWFLISLARLVVNDHAEHHTKLRQDIATLTLAKTGSIGTIRLDILQAVALMEVLFLVKYAMFSIENNLMEIMGSDPFTFATCYSNKVGSLIQPVILTTMMVPRTHVHKTVVSTKSGQEL